VEIVLVEWVDSYSLMADWTTDPEGAMNELDNYSVVVHSVGYLARDWHDRILLIQNNGHDQFLNAIVIPKVSIQKTERLEVTDGLRRTE
jgi:hypothetical protein